MERAKTPSRGAMFDHVEFAVSNIGACRTFYKTALAAVGHEEAFFDEAAGEAAFGRGGITGLLIYKGELGPLRHHICFTASSRQQVDSAHAAAMTAGGRDNGGPGYRNHYAPGYYAAFVFDPDGNNIEFLFRERQP